MDNSFRKIGFWDNNIINIHKKIVNITDVFSNNTQNKSNLDINSTKRPYPAEKIKESNLTTSEIKTSSQMMRVNYSGEVCAQALYFGQALTARDKSKKQFLLDAAREEKDHLDWCKLRLTELNSHTSILNPIWFLGSVIIGAFAGICGDKWSLGFLAETEFQVTSHLEKHLNNISTNDKKSIAIIEQMREDELKHATSAIDIGAQTLPYAVKDIMRYTAKVMTFTATYI